MFWMCISGNLLVGAGLLLQRPLPLRIGALWLSLGLGLWFVFSVMREGTSVPSVLVHAGGLLVALIGVARAGMSLNTWLYAA
ncbi:MAG TPA: hypothetical protein VNL69_12380, partial [Bacteroidota bacterium]|nr:hypothetical protein [Bacteroidota bacterium]